MSGEKGEKSLDAGRFSLFFFQKNKISQSKIVDALEPATTGNERRAPVTEQKPAPMRVIRALKLSYGQSVV